MRGWGAPGPGPEWQERFSSYTSPCHDDLTQRPQRCRERRDHLVKEKSSRRALLLCELRLRPSVSAVLVHHELEDLTPGADAVERQRRERLVDDVQLREEVVLVGLDVENARRELAAR